MSFLEMAKQYLSNASQKADQRILGGYSVNQVLWETDTAVIFRDSKGHFWRYLKAGQNVTSVVVSSKRENLC
jgi:hypothetical protein